MLRLGLSVAAVALAVDQLSKWWLLVRAFGIEEGLSAGSFFDLMVMGDESLSATVGTLATVTPFFDLVLAWNRGISFSVFTSDSSVAPWIFSGVAVTICIGLGIWLRRMVRPWPAVAVGLIIGGAIGNVLDRVRYKAVVDFLSFHWQETAWPAFNLADTAITVGVAMLLMDGLFSRADGAKRTAN
jgi:signal peptidase II